MNKKEEIRNRRVSECVFKYSSKKILAMKAENPFFRQVMHETLTENNLKGGT